MDHTALGVAVLLGLATTPDVSERLGTRHTTIAMWAHQMISLLRRWLPDRAVTQMGEPASTVLELGLHAQARQVTLVTTGRVDVVLHAPPPARPEHPSGRPRVIGERVPALETVREKPETVWQKLTLDWDGQGKRTVEVWTGIALWDRSGSDPVPIRWVFPRDPLGTHPAKAIVSTDPTQTGEPIIRDCMKRWSLDVAGEERRAHLGMETQRQWSDLALERSTPLLFGLSRLVALFGYALCPEGQIPVAQATWSRKQTATFRDVLAAVRQHLWHQETFCPSPTDPGVVVVTRAPLERWSWAVCSCVGHGQRQAERMRVK